MYKFYSLTICLLYNNNNNNNNNNNVTSILLKNKNCALKFVDEIILYYDALSKKHQIENIFIPNFNLL